MTQCIECKFLDLQKSKDMSRHGFGFCTLTSATFYSLHKKHDCNKFQIGEKSKIDARIEWFENRKG